MTCEIFDHLQSHFFPQDSNICLQTTRKDVTGFSAEFGLCVGTRTHVISVPLVADFGQNSISTVVSENSFVGWEILSNVPELTSHIALLPLESSIII